MLRSVDNWTDHFRQRKFTVTRKVFPFRTLAELGVFTTDVCQHPEFGRLRKRSCYSRIMQSSMIKESIAIILIFHGIG